MIYADLLRSPHWQRKRLKICERDNWTCLRCLDTERELQVHHTFYDGRKPWDYPDESMKTLCVDCHALITDLQKCLKAKKKRIVNPETMTIVVWEAKARQLLGLATESPIKPETFGVSEPPRGMFGPELIARTIGAQERGDWAEAERLFLERARELVWS